jgi:hypothetical protein
MSAGINQIACGALQVECKIPCHGTQMAAIVWLLGQISGVTDCNAILAGANSLSCLSRQQQLPAMIFLLQQIFNAGGVVGPIGPQGPAGPAGPLVLYNLNFAGQLPNFIPPVSAGQLALNYDPSSGQLSYYSNGAWTF